MPSIIVTGAGSGIGRATARRFLAAGWQVGLIGRRPEPLQETAEGHAQARIMPCDVADETAMAAAFDAAQKDWGRLDALFNNAGINVAAGPIDEIPVADWRRVVDINLTGAFIAARAAFACMRAQNPQGGRIINNGSISAHAPRWGSTPYTATKHAITGLTKAIALDGRPYAIACGQIDIGNALTEMVEKMTAGVPQADGQIAVEPVMDVAHVAEAVLQMASLPLDANVQTMTLMATNMPFLGRG
ncbi:MAG: SDR family oxidoreductase [Pseudomonadota bacterium]